MINKVNKTDISRTLQRITANEQTFQVYICVCVYVCVCVCVYIIKIDQMIDHKLNLKHY